MKFIRHNRVKRLISSLVMICFIGNSTSWDAFRLGDLASQTPDSGASNLQQQALLLPLTNFRYILRRGVAIGTLVSAFGLRVDAFPALQVPSADGKARASYSSTPAGTPLLSPRLLDFFQDEAWSNFIDAPSEPRANELTDKAVKNFVDNRELLDAVSLLSKNWQKLNDASVQKQISSAWLNLNERILEPNHILGILLMQRLPSGGVGFGSAMFSLDRTELVPFDKAHTAQMYYGRRIDRGRFGRGQGGWTLPQLGISIVDIGEAERFAKQWSALNIGQYPQEFQGLLVRIRGSNSEQKIVDAKINTVRAHELMELLIYSGLGFGTPTAESLGIPLNQWAAMDDGFKMQLIVDREGYLAAVKASNTPELVVLELMDQFNTLAKHNLKDPHYWAAFNALNTLSNQNTKRWNTGENPEATLNFLMDLTRDRNSLAKRAAQKLSEHYPGASALFDLLSPPADNKSSDTGDSKNEVSLEPSSNQGALHTLATHRELLVGVTAGVAGTLALKALNTQIHKWREGPVPVRQIVPNDVQLWAGQTLRPDLLPAPGKTQNQSSRTVLVRFALYPGSKDLAADSLVNEIGLRGHAMPTGPGTVSKRLQKIPLEDLRVIGKDPEGNYLITANFTIPRRMQSLEYSLALGVGDRDLPVETPGHANFVVQVLPKSQLDAISEDLGKFRALELFNRNINTIKRRGELWADLRAQLKVDWAGHLIFEPEAVQLKGKAYRRVWLSASLADKRYPPEHITTRDFIDARVWARGTDGIVKLENLRGVGQDSDGNYILQGLLPIAGRPKVELSALLVSTGFDQEENGKLASLTPTELEALRISIDPARSADWAIRHALPPNSLALITLGILGTALLKLFSWKYGVHTPDVGFAIIAPVILLQKLQPAIRRISQHFRQPSTDNPALIPILHQIRAAA
jgi:hypothetical protein